MKNRTKILMLIALFGCIAALAQDAKIEKVELFEPYTPLYVDGEEGLTTIQVRGLVATGTSDKKWFRIVTEYSTSAEWLDRLTIEYYVLFPGETVVFKGVLNYIDLQEKRDHLSEVYLHFNTYARHYARGTIQYAVVVLIDGKQVDFQTNKRSPENWWKEMPVNPCGLLPREFTPFVVFNVERFEARDHCSWQ